MKKFKDFMIKNRHLPIKELNEMADKYIEKHYDFLVMSTCLVLLIFTILISVWCLNTIYS